MIEPPAPHDQQRQPRLVTWQLGWRSSWPGTGHDTLPFAGTTIPATASKYTAGRTVFSGSSAPDSATAPGLVDVAAMPDAPAGWWAFGQAPGSCSTVRSRQS